MKKIGCFVVILGVLFALGSCAVFGGMIKNTFEAQEVKSFPLELNKPYVSEIISVNTKKACQLKLTVNVVSESIKKEEHFDDDQYTLQYNFPVKYKIIDENDKIIFCKDTAATSMRGSRSISNKEISLSGGRATIKHGFEKFIIPSPGKIKIEAEVKPDITYNAKANSLILAVYDNVPQYASSFIRGIMMSFAGPFLIVIGMIVFIFGLVLKK